VCCNLLPADGTCEVVGHTYLIMEDLTAGYQQPCILDIKVSVVCCGVLDRVRHMWSTQYSSREVQSAVKGRQTMQNSPCIQQWGPTIAVEAHQSEAGT
jgi:hypothetical protein